MEGGLRCTGDSRREFWEGWDKNKVTKKDKGWKRRAAQGKKEKLWKKKWAQCPAIIQNVIEEWKLEENVRANRGEQIAPHFCLFILHIDREFTWEMVT